MKVININLRGLILTATLLVSFMSFSQDLNIKRISNAKIVNMVTGDTLSSHASDIEAIQQLQNYKNQGLNVKMLGSVYDVDLGINKTIEVDTLTISGFWHTYGQYGAYFRLLNGGNIIKVQTDTVMNWQRDIEVKRIKTFGKVSYENTNKIPFQIRKIYLTEATDVEVRLNVNITEKQKSIKGYLDNKLYIQFSPGSSTKITDTDYYFYFFIKGLSKGKEYNFRVEVESISGDINFENISITL